MIPLPVNTSIAMFSSTISAYDTESAYKDHEWVQNEKSDDYTFSGRVAPISNKEAAILEEGFVSQGVVVIHTISKPLYYVDASQGVTRGRQTYIYHQRDIYRVFKEMNRQIQGAYYRYLAVKHEPRTAVTDLDKVVNTDDWSQGTPNSSTILPVNNVIRWTYTGDWTVDVLDGKLINTITGPDTAIADNAIIEEWDRAYIDFAKEDHEADEALIFRILDPDSGNYLQWRVNGNGVDASWYDGSTLLNVWSSSGLPTSGTFEIRLEDNGKFSWILDGDKKGSPTDTVGVFTRVQLINEVTGATEQTVAFDNFNMTLKGEQLEIE